MTRIRLALTVALATAGCRHKTNAVASDEPVPEPLSDLGPSTADPREAVPGFVGALVPRGSADVPALFTTTVKQVLVELGAVVEQGQPLALLDDGPLREQLDVANAELANAAVSRSSAASLLKHAKQGVRDGVEPRSSVTEAQFAVREAGTLVAKARATVDAVKKKLESTTLVAPIAGKIAMRQAEAGTRVEEGQPVIRVITSDELFIRFAIPPDQAGTVKEGEAVDVVIVSSGAKAKAVVRSVSPGIDPIARAIVAEADFQGDVPPLTPQDKCRVLTAAMTAAKPSK